MSDKTTLRKKRPISIIILAGLLSTLLMLSFLPSLLSSDWAADTVKQVVNERIPGDVDFEAISISWSKGIRCRGLAYDNRAAGIVVKVADVVTTKGLLAIAANYKEVGAVKVTSPAVYYYVKEKPSSAGSRKQSPIEQQSSEKSSTSPIDARQQDSGVAEESDGRAFPPIDGQLIITDGSLTAVLPDGTESPVVQSLEMELTVAGRDSSLAYQLAFQSADGVGRVKGAGSVALTAAALGEFDKIQSQATLAIDNWETADLLSILAVTAETPTGSGVLNGQLSISGSTETGLQLKANVSGRQIRLAGGPLGTDTPTLDKVEVAVDALRTTSVLTINRLSLVSPLATGQITGSFGGADEKEMNGQALIDVAQIFTQFPGTLKLKEGIKVSKGKIDLTARISATGKATAFDGRARLDTLQGVADKKKISWDTPVTLAAKGEQGPGGFRLDHFGVQSAFLNGKGQGDINDLQIQLAADIDAALKEFEKFIKIDDWKSSGKLELDLHVNSTAAEMRTVAADVSIKDFVLQQKKQIIAPRGAFTAKLRSELRLDEELRLEEIQSTAIDFQSWIGNGRLSFNTFIPPSEQISAGIKDLVFTGDIRLVQLADMLHSLGSLPGDTRLAGRANIATRMSMERDKVTLGETTVALKDLLLELGIKKISEKELNLTTRGAVDLKNKSIILDALDLQTTAGHMALPEVLVTDWRQLENSLKVNGTIDLNLDMLTKQLGDVLKLPDGAVVAGKAAITIAVDMTSPKKQHMQLDGTAGQVSVTFNNKSIFSEDTIRLAMDLQGNVRDQDFAFNKLAIATPPLSLSAVGTIVPVKKERRLTAEGSITLDLQRLSSILRSLFDLDLEMTGVSERPFTVATMSTDGQWLELQKNSDLSAALSAESIKGAGLHITSLDLPVHLAGGRGTADIKGGVNRGKMAFIPAIDFSTVPPVFSIPENTTILTGVGLTEDLSNDLLGKVHPIFKGAAVSSGTVDLTTHYFNWPMLASARKDATFAGSLTFKDTRLEAGGFLAPILAIMKVEDRQVTISENAIECVGKDDRVQCSSMEILINEYSLLLAGSVGFDTSLQYTAKIPVTRKMVSGDVYKYLEGTFITVPIGGTVSRPAISKDLVQTAIKDLVIQAGTKQLTEQTGKLLQNLLKQ